MTLSPPPELLTCHIARGFDLARCGLILDYRGDQPPLELFDALKAAGWETPAPAAPPAGAIDWSRPDAATGRRWSTKPFLVVGAMAVPGRRTPAGCATREWLRSTLDGLGIALEAEEIHVGVLRDIEPGLAEVLPDRAPAVTERDLARRAHMAEVFAATPSIASVAPTANRVVAPAARPAAPAARQDAPVPSRPAAAPVAPAARRAAPAPAVAPAPAAAPAARPAAVIDVRRPEPAIDLTVPVPAEPVARPAGGRDSSTVVALHRFRNGSRSTRRAPESTVHAAPVDDGTSPLVWRPPVASAR